MIIFSLMTIITHKYVPKITSTFSIPKSVIIQNIIHCFITCLISYIKLFSFYEPIPTHYSLTLSRSYHIPIRYLAIMVDTRHGTKTSRKEKKSMKKTKKPIMEPKHGANVHGVKMKGVFLGGKADGPAGGPPTLEPPKEFKNKQG